MSAAYDYYAAWKHYKQKCTPGGERAYMAEYPEAWQLVREIMRMRNA